ncbi:putative F-box/LRR-repeat protein At3g18150 [Brassica rapa]|uniref:F-box domain-containing protein n=1 Tax=Brassica campestris TaxID=3711 RepID=M4E0K4_BRACM|nr:putative F-box/LRR-repeat protein At3g18150 [Brassica rapa]
MSQGKMADDRRIKAAVDLISNLPDEILQHILCFIRIKLAITTSLLSRRWKHVWCEIPSLSLDATILTAASVNKTLSHYTAPKTKSFHLKTYRSKYTPHINRWIKCAMSHNVENLSLDFWANSYPYKLPDFFYNSSSFRQLNIKLIFFHTIVPECTVSWKFLRKLSLSGCTLSDESLAKILTGCPILEYLTLCHCSELKVLDLRKSLRLRTLQIRRDMSVPGPTQIVAPHIHSLRLLNSQLSCTFVDVASLTEAKLDICYVSVNPNLKADFLQTMVLKMLEKIQNVEKLTFGGNFIQILSLAEIRGVSFPMLKVKTLTLDTDICQYVIPGIERLLQNSPDLETLTALSRDFNSMPGKYLDQYLKSQGFNLNTCWRSTSLNNRGVDLTSEHVASFVELMLKHTKKLDKMLVLLDERFLQFEIEDVVVPTFPHNKNVNVVLCATKLMVSEQW